MKSRATKLLAQLRKSAFAEFVARPIRVAVSNSLWYPIWNLEYFVRRYILRQVKGEVLLGLVVLNTPQKCSCCDGTKYYGQVKSRWDTSVKETAPKAEVK